MIDDFITLDLHVPMVDEDQKEDRKKVLVEYFVEDRGVHDMYALKFFFCEFLNLINVIGQLFFMDFFLGGEFSTYGAEVLSMTNLEQEDRTDPMSRVFPKVTKCTFHKFGPSGTVQGFDGLCVLPLNIINEKIYVFLWFWFVILAVITALQVALQFFSQLMCHVSLSAGNIPPGHLLHAGPEDQPAAGPGQALQEPAAGDGHLPQVRTRRLVRPLPAREEH